MTSYQERELRRAELLTTLAFMGLFMPLAGIMCCIMARRTIRNLDGAPINDSDSLRIEKVLHRSEFWLRLTIFILALEAVVIGIFALNGQGSVQFRPTMNVLYPGYL